MNKEIQLKAKESLDFIRSHPAFTFDNGDSICPGVWFMMAPCCKRNRINSSITIYQDNPHWEDYIDLLDKDIWDETDFKSIDVPYERMYGEPWVYDHMEYWYEITFFVFEGNPYISEDLYDSRKWGRYGGPEGGASSFEEMLIKIADDVKNNFGDFNVYDHFHTPAEKNNHEIEKYCTWLPCENLKLRQMVFNNKYIDVLDSLINLRWTEWFMTTKYAKKNWRSSFKQWRKFVNNIKVFEDSNRRDILAKYENINS